MDYDDLTHRQAAILEFIKKETLIKGYPPTVREIAAAMGLSSPATVHSHLATLEKKGYIKRDSSKQRALEVTDAIPPVEKEMLYLPVVGVITAGQPILAQENIEDYFPVPAEMVRARNEVFMLTVQGESMIEAGIFDGDYIIVEKTPVVHNGEAAVVLIEDSATVKYFYKENGMIRLQPANSTMQPIYVKDAAVLGRVVGLFRAM